MMQLRMSGPYCFIHDDGDKNIKKMLRAVFVAYRSPILKRKSQEDGSRWLAPHFWCQKRPQYLNFLSIPSAQRLGRIQNRCSVCRGRHSALWKWRLPRHVGRTHTLPRGLCRYYYYSISHFPSLRASLFTPLSCYSLYFDSQLPFFRCSPSKDICLAVLSFVDFVEAQVAISESRASLFVHSLHSIAVLRVADPSYRSPIH
jgi:hypothetical protein